MAFFAIVGTDVHRLPLQELERIAGAGRDAVGFARRASDRLGGAECAAIVTCNRVELAVAGATPIEAASLGAAFYRALGIEDAPPALVRCEEAGLRHLLRVACSLESAALGEEQILGQVRDTIRTAREAGIAGARLACAFDLALRVGKRVRRETELAELGTDLSRLTHRHLRPELRAASTDPVVLLGTGAMARAVLAARPKDGREHWLVVGRERARTEALARECACAAATLDEFLAATTPIRALVAATRTIRPVITKELLQARLALGAGVVDLGLPRNVDPAARTHARLADLADLNELAEVHRAKLGATVERIDSWIDEALARQRRRAAPGVPGAAA